MTDDSPRAVLAAARKAALPETSTQRRKVLSDQLRAALARLDMVQALEVPATQRPTAATTCIADQIIANWDADRARRAAKLSRPAG